MKEGDKVYFISRLWGNFKLQTSTIKSLAPKTIILHTDIEYKRRYKRENGVMKTSFEEAKERIVTQINTEIDIISKRLAERKSELDKAKMLTEDSFTEGG